MIDVIAPTLAGALAGAIAGGLLAWWLLRRQSEAIPDQVDPWVEAEIDQAAVSWAVQHGQPQAAPFMADKLRLLHRLGQRHRRRP